MNRSLIILVGVVALGAALFSGSFFTARHATLACCVRPADNLSWLRTEFHLTDAQMAQIRTLHDGYLPLCAANCAKIAAKQSELEAAMAGSTNMTPPVHALMQQLAALRAQCQAQMLQHFTAVSQAMPPAEGQRYLDEMKQLTLGSQAEMEQSMSDAAGHEHHDH